MAPPLRAFWFGPGDRDQEASEEPAFEAAVADLLNAADALTPEKLEWLWAAIVAVLSTFEAQQNPRLASALKEVLMHMP